MAALLGVLVLAGRDVARAQSQVQSPAGASADWVLGLPSRPGLILAFLAVGVVGLPLGAHMVVNAAVEIAIGIGVTETVAGLTIVAVSTSLPELATTVVAARRHETDVVIGTIVGSNIFNIVLIMGVAAVVSPTAISVSRSFALLDLPVMLGAALLVTLFAWTGRRIGRRVGAVFAIGYVAYFVTLFVRA